ncbi:isopenicillin N synthase family dioxygenase [Paracraurococcus lichenis]|uniref:2-oxoglutarate-dependent ethylene/succinate-forming enzyme n=1 Tax=Paracraurococcus lichenis TaxID=3064888 RepID=A0ABT9DUC2_9PROT|nr:2-oxoglutarate and iron-dependent oxygenase domain-containing protein [Paracraurococcus sp. LOR1-02]MDO9707500.1 2-oxoglutarate and iron-dependent oxygenase domain-containing protein [Paracraurococcus sp. LOR1-02]
MSLAEGRIPVLDIGPARAGAPGAAEDLAARIARTCEDTGFLVIAGHGIDPALPAACFEAAARFFALPEEDKLALRIGEYNIGYLPTGAQVIRTSKVAEVKQPNLNESFYIIRDYPPDHPAILEKRPFVAPNRWPPHLPGFREATLAYFTAMEALAQRLLPAVSMALGMPPDHLARDFRDPTCTLRLIRYQPQPAPEAGRFGFAPHIDTNLLTFLAQSALPGLEVRTAEGDWIRPPAIPGTFVVNTAEMLGRYSNGRFTPTPHRVLNQNDAMRYAIPFFFGPDNDAVIRPVPSCISAENPCRFEPLLYEDHRRMLNLRNFAHRQPQPAEA